MASDSRFESLLKTWHGHTQKGDIEDYERQDQMRSLLRELAPDPTYAIVRARKRRFGSPAGLDVVEVHEILVLDEGQPLSVRWHGGG